MSSELNNVKNRFLPIPESAEKGLEHEAKINDFEILKFNKKLIFVQN